MLAFVSSANEQASIKNYNAIMFEFVDLASNISIIMKIVNY